MFTLILTGLPRYKPRSDGLLELELDGPVTLFRTEAGYLGERQLDVDQTTLYQKDDTVTTDSDGLVSFTHNPPDRTGTFKVVIQVPIGEGRDLEEFTSLNWDESSDRTGPHTRVNIAKDPETGETCLYIRCKHNSDQALRGLVDRVYKSLPILLDG